MTLGPTLAQQFGTWSAALTAGHIPAEVARIARRAIVDTLGVMTAGAKHPATLKAIAAFGDQAGPCRIVNGASVSGAAAALINGTAAHAWDMDDTSYTGIMHGSAVVLPAVLAAAGETGADDATVLAAFVAGSEIAYVLGDIIGHAHYFRGWWSTTTLGLVGATAAAARVYGLNAAATAEAIGLAAAIAGGGKAVFGTDGKPFLVGMAARTALDLARAARAGLTGPERAFEDPHGFLALLGDADAAPAVAGTLGQRWRLTDPGLLVKRYPICSAAHAAVEQTAALCQQAGAGADRIAAIECHVPTLVDISLVHDAPRTAQEAQFSLPFTVACAAHHGAVRLDDLTETTLADPAIRAIMARVRKFRDPALSTDAMLASCPESARIVVVLDDGQRFDAFCGIAYGMPTRPLSDDDLKAKFDACVAHAGIAPDLTAAARDTMFHLGAAGRRDLAAALATLWPGNCVTGMITETA